jgi:SAM-dependent methyltransferase
MSDGRDAVRHDPGAYGEGCASYYDQIYPRVPADLVDALAELAAGSPALELGLATGRVARALAARGVEVHAVEASRAMLRQFRMHGDHAAVAAVRGDMSDLPYRRTFGLVFALCGTLELLPTRALQQRCIGEVARVLRPGAWFVCELSGLAGGGRIDTEVPVVTAQGVRPYRVSLLPMPREACAAMLEELGLVPSPAGAVASLFAGSQHVMVCRNG